MSIKKIATYVIGEGLAKLSPFLVIPYLTRTLSPEGYGELAIIVGYISLSYIFINFSQDSAASRAYFRYGDKSAIKVMSYGVLYSIVMAVLLTIILICVGEFQYALIPFVAFLQVVITNALVIKQCKEKSLSYMLIQVSMSLMSTVLIIILIEIFDFSSESRLYSYLYTYLFLAMMILAFDKDIIYQFKNRIKRDKIYFNYMVAFGLPLIVHNLAFFAKSQFDRVYIFSVYGSGDLGVYFSAYQLASILSILLMAANRAMLPYLFKGFKNDEIKVSDIRKLSIYIIFMTPIIFFLSSLIPEELYVYIFGDGYNDVGKYFPIFLFAFSVHGVYLILSNVLFYNGRSDHIAMANLVSGIIYVVSILILNDFGLDYIPFSLLISNFLLVVMVFKYVSDEEKKNCISSSTQ
ncbi:oligosaccharide flippase family protein [Vibrio cholerae]|uniref:oligosaccharide flippase family protein n=1 Tax=Vibrio cholerae TaxID=666 RepID=UPI0035AB4E8A